MKLLIIIAMALIVTGCSRSKDENKNGTKTNSQGGKSTAQTLLDGFTGRTAVRAGKKARKQITDISEKRDKRLEEILGEE
ncbi:MAG: hypothetical protein R6V03_04635 [Kiritimatiellia bacterium]